MQVKQTYAQEFLNEKTKTLTISYPKELNAYDMHHQFFMLHFLPEEIEEADAFIVSYPFGKPYPIVAYVKNGYIQLTIDRDCYEIELQFIHLIGDIAEIYYETEDVTLVREYLTKYYHQNKTK